MKQIGTFTPGAVLTRLNTLLAQDANAPQVTQEVASDLKALRFETKLYVTSSDCMLHTTVPPYISARDASAAVSWTVSTVLGVVAAFNAYMGTGGAEDLQVYCCCNAFAPRVCLTPLVFLCAATLRADTAAIDGAQ
jgi:hypothetical protein